MSKKSGRRRRQQRALQRSKAQNAKGQPLGPQERGTMASFSATVTSTTTSYSGPIPPPEILRQYEEVSPGSVALILEWAGSQAKHRQGLEEYALKHEARRSWGGLIAGFFVAMTAIVGGITAILYGYDTAGASVISLTVVSLVSTFLYGTWSRKSERQSRNEALIREKQKRLPHE